MVQMIMGGPVKFFKPGTDEPAVADAVVEAFAKSVDTREKRSCWAFTLDSGFCMDGIDDENACDVIVPVLATASFGEITKAEEGNLFHAGFSNDFINRLAGPDGKRALHARAKWLGEHIMSSRWRQPQFTETRRADMVAELSDYSLQGENVIPYLLDAMNNEKGRVRWAAAVMLGNLQVKEALPVLEEIILDESKDVIERYRALDALESMTAFPDNVRAILMRTVGADRRRILPLVLKALAMYHIDEPEYVARLMGMRTMDEYCTAMYVLEIGGDQKRVSIKTAAVFIECLNDINPRVRANCATALSFFGERARYAIPTLDRMVEHDPHPVCRGRAAAALAKITEGVL